VIFTVKDQVPWPGSGAKSKGFEALGSPSAPTKKLNVVSWRSLAFTRIVATPLEYE
jgi:hypothetical protein